MLLNSYHHKPVHINNSSEQAAPYRSVQPYPGYEQQVQQAPAYAPETQYSPYLPAVPAAQPPAKSGAAGLLSKLDFNQIKATIDRMGGIEGILATVSKVQQVMQTVSQFGPMLKMIIPKFGSKSSDYDDEDDYPRRRRRRKRRHSSGIRSGSGGRRRRRRRSGSAYVQQYTYRPSSSSRRRSSTQRRRR